MALIKSSHFCKFIFSNLIYSSSLGCIRALLNIGLFHLFPWMMILSINQFFWVILLRTFYHFVWFLPILRSYSQYLALQLLPANFQHYMPHHSLTYSYTVCAFLGKCNDIVTAITKVVNVFLFGFMEIFFSNAMLAQFFYLSPLSVYLFKIKCYIRDIRNISKS